MDIRSAPFPPNFPVVSTPGMFTGWTLTCEIYGVLSNIVIDRTDAAGVVAHKLRLLANMVEKG